LSPSNLYIFTSRQGKYKQKYEILCQVVYKTVPYDQHLHELMGIPNWITNSLIIFFPKFILWKCPKINLVHETWNLIGSDFHVADCLLVSLCYWCSDRHHTDLCTQWTLFTWIWFEQTYSVKNDITIFSTKAVYLWLLRNIRLFFRVELLKTLLVDNIIVCQI
jgi:hypothetical protein